MQALITAILAIPILIIGLIMGAFQLIMQMVVGAVLIAGVIVSSLFGGKK